MPNWLLSFVGGNDPYSTTRVAGQDVEGPLLTIVRHGPVRFAGAALFATPNMAGIQEETARILRGEDKLEVLTIPLSLPDPTDHAAILDQLRSAAVPLADKGDIYISATSGTPQIHACWFLLAASGELPATMLQVRRPNHVTTSAPAVHMIDLTAPDIPRVVSTNWVRTTSDPAQGDCPALRESIGLLGQAPAFLKAVSLAGKVAATFMNVLIIGETGTGKEVFAKYIHNLSSRKGPFVPVNCASFSEQLMESELFGHVKGAFTGANADKEGLFEAADGGTLFLDEIGELPAPLQAKLLRAIESKNIRPVGAPNERPVDVRIISATNADLATAVKEKKFRQDLLQRLRGVEVHLPPLRSRRDDIPLLAQHFLGMGNAAPPRFFTPGALKALTTLVWPGNVRELKQAIEYLLTFSTGSVIEKHDVEEYFQEQASSRGEEAWLPDPHEGFNYKEFMQRTEAHLKQRALDLAGGSLTGAARLLGISPQQLHKDNKENKIVKSHKNQP